MVSGDLESKLVDFDLSLVEAKIYLHLLNKQPQTVLSLARELRIPRTSVYDNVLKLVEKGLLERVVKFKSQEFKASPLDQLSRTVEKEKRKVESLAQTLDQLKQILVNPIDPSTSTQVRYYHGTSGIQQMMWNATKAIKETVGYSVYGRVEIVGSTFMKKFIEVFIENKIRDRVIVNPTKQTLDIIKKDVKPGRHQNTFNDIRYLPQSQLYVSGDTTIYNNIFAVAYWKQGEIVGVEIENAELVHTQKTIFETLWKLAKPVATLIKNN